MQPRTGSPNSRKVREHNATIIMDTYQHLPRKILLWESFRSEASRGRTTHTDGPRKSQNSLIPFATEPSPSVRCVRAIPVPLKATLTEFQTGSSLCEQDLLVGLPAIASGLTPTARLRLLPPPQDSTNNPDVRWSPRLDPLVSRRLWDCGHLPLRPEFR